MLVKKIFELISEYICTGEIQIHIIFHGHFISIFEYSNICAHHCYKPCISQTVRAGELKFWENVHPQPCVTCHVSCVRCHVSGSRCQVLVFFIFFFYLVELVCCHRGLHPWFYTSEVEYINTVYFNLKVIFNTIFTSNIAKTTYFSNLDTLSWLVLRLL